jgi:hypothetical protein
MMIGRSGYLPAGGVCLSVISPGLVHRINPLVVPPLVKLLGGPIMPIVLVSLIVTIGLTLTRMLSVPALELLRRPVIPVMVVPIMGTVIPVVIIPMVGPMVPVVVVPMVGPVIPIVVISMVEILRGPVMSEVVAAMPELLLRPVVPEILMHWGPMLAKLVVKLRSRHLPSEALVGSHHGSAAPASRLGKGHGGKNQGRQTNRDYANYHPTHIMPPKVVNGGFYTF